MKKSTLVISSLAAITLAGIVALKSNVYADETNNFSPLMQRIMERFNISSNDMTSTLNDFGQERSQLREDHMTTQLDAAVSAGKLTEDQKNQFIELNSNWFNRKDTWRDLTRDERNQLAEEHRTAVEEWETTNGIDMHDLMGEGMEFREGIREGFGKGMMGRGHMFEE